MLLTRPRAVTYEGAESADFTLRQVCPVCPHFPRLVFCRARGRFPCPCSSAPASTSVGIREQARQFPRMFPAISLSGAPGEGHAEEVTRAVFAQDDVRHPAHDVGVPVGHVVVFVEVGGQVIEAGHAADHHQLPVAHAQPDLVCLVELPVEEVMLRLPFVLPQQGGGEGEAVEAVTLQVFVYVLLGEALVADKFAEGRQHVVEGELMVIDPAGGDVPRPPGNEGHADAALVTLAFQAAQLAVPAEERGVCTALLVGAVVAAEDDQRVLSQALLLQLGQNLAHIGIQPGNHAGEVGVRVFHRVVARAFAPAPGLVGEELFLVPLQDGVFGLCQFGVGQGVGEDAAERLRAVLAVQPPEGPPVDEVGGVLRAVAVVVAEHGVADVLFQYLAHHGGVAHGTAEAVEEVGIIEVGLILADVAVVLVHAALVRGGDGALVAAGPLAEHAGGVSVAFHHFGQDDVARVIGLLARDGVVFVPAVHHLPLPVFLVAAHVSVAGVLSGHQGGARRCADRASGIGLGEEHALLGHTVEVGGPDVLLSVAAQVAVAHVIAEDEEDVGLCVLVFVRRVGIHCAGCGDEAGAKEGKSVGLHANVFLGKRVVNENSLKDRENTAQYLHFKAVLISY